MRCAIAQSAVNCHDSPTVARGLAASTGNGTVQPSGRQMAAVQLHTGIATPADRDSELTTWVWHAATGLPAKSEDRVRTRRLKWDHVAYCLILLVCGILFGLFVGGFVGFMENATPHGGALVSFEQSATSSPTGKWADMIKHYRAAPGGHLRSLAESETVSDPQPLGAAASKTAEQSVSAAPGFGAAKKAVVVR